MAQHQGAKKNSLTKTHQNSVSFKMDNLGLLSVTCKVLKSMD